MFAEKEHVSDGVGLTRRDDPFLQLPRLGVGQQPKIDLQQFIHAFAKQNLNLAVFSAVTIKR
jgi:hypothetical protein